MPCAASRAGLERAARWYARPWVGTSHACASSLRASSDEHDRFSRIPTDGAPRGVPSEAGDLRMSTHTTRRQRASRARRRAQAALIAGGWRDGAGGDTFAVEDPATGEPIALVADATPPDGLDALAAADEAWRGAWRDSAPRERSDILRRAYEAIVDRADELALLMTLEMGKPLAESRAEVTYGASFLRWYAEEAVRIDGRFTTHEAGSGRLLTIKQPVGPCVFITPWNFPLAMGTRKIGPAIAAGCTMVVKPAKLTPLSMLMLAEDPRGGGAARRRAERRHGALVRFGHGAADPRSADAQALVHRLDRGRACAHRAGLRAGAARLDGARRQRPVRRVRGRRSRRRARRRHDRQDAQHRRGVHGRQPLPRRRSDRRRGSPRASPSGCRR